MSDNNGTALVSSGDTSAIGLAAWLESGDSPAPLDTVDTDRAAESQSEDEPGRGSPRTIELNELREKLRHDTQVVQIHMQRHTAHLGELSDRERRAERRQAEKLRKMQRDQQVSATEARLRRQKRAAAAAEREADEEAKEKLWQRRALAKRSHLLDSSARLASLHRTQLFVSFLLVGVAAAGIMWTSVGVHHALVGPGGNPLAYAVEPLFSLPLIVIMLVQSRAAQWGRQFPAPDSPSRAKVLALEVGLLAAVILVNVSPVVPMLGTWQGATTLMSRLMPPALILVAVVLHPLVSSFLSNLMVSAYVNPEENDTRLNDAEFATADLARRVHNDWQTGQLRESPTGGPSIKHAAELYAIEKRKAQRAVDLWRCMYS